MKAPSKSKIKTNLSVTYPIRFTQAQYDWLKANGGSKLVRSLVIAEMNTAEGDEDAPLINKKTTNNKGEK